MADTEKTATAQNGEKKTRTRKPSPFKPTIRAIVNVHNTVAEGPTAVSLGEKIKSLFPEFAVRTTSRSRKGSKGTGPAALAIYIAPKGYEFPAVTTAERGVRIPAEVANLLRSIAESMGKDSSDPAVLSEIAKSLAESASKKLAEQKNNK